MINHVRVIYLVCANPVTTQGLLTELLNTRGDCQLPIALTVEQAHRSLVRANPVVILLDESAVRAEREDPSAALESAVADLTEYAPVVVIAAPERQTELAFLIASGAVDFVARVGNYLPLAAGMIERRVRMAEQADSGPTESALRVLSDFGELLRHEVNNPLTGILGNAELLVAEFARKTGAPPSPSALQRARTIAELAVRLRETVRRISDEWAGRHEHARSA